MKELDKVIRDLDRAMIVIGVAITVLFAVGTYTLVDLIRVLGNSGLNQ